MQDITLENMLRKCQEYIAGKYASALTNKSKREELKNYIAKYLYDTNYKVSGYDEEQLVERLFIEMADYSVLTQYLTHPQIEEININGWDDIAITYLDGRIEKTKECFFSPGHATDIVKKLLKHSGMSIATKAPNHAIFFAKIPLFGVSRQLNSGAIRPPRAPKKQNFI